MSWSLIQSVMVAVTVLMVLVRYSSNAVTTLSFKQPALLPARVINYSGITSSPDHCCKPARIHRTTAERFKYKRDPELIVDNEWIGKQPQEFLRRVR